MMWSYQKTTTTRKEPKTKDISNPYENSPYRQACPAPLTEGEQAASMQCPFFSSASLSNKIFDLRNKIPLQKILVCLRKSTNAQGAPFFFHCG
jgi:hypothetical protein